MEWAYSYNPEAGRKGKKTANAIIAYQVSLWCSILS